MLLILEARISESRLADLHAKVRAAGLEADVLDSEVEGGRLLLSVGARLGENQNLDPDPDLRAQLRLMPGVERVLDFGAQTPLVSSASASFSFRAPSEGRLSHGDSRGESESERQGDPSPFEELGPKSFAFIAGPCSVERPETLGEIASAVASAGATMLRGGAYKPRTSPYSFQGLGRTGLLLLESVGRDFGLPLVTEVLDPRDVDFVSSHADVLQVGARNMQNFALLREVGASGTPVMLKRGVAASLEEWLLAAEYVLSAGCSDLVLCERGVKSQDPGRPRILDLGVIPALREKTSLRILVDPSHATGKRAYVAPLAKAAVAAGADGVMVEVHPSPSDALSDGAQALLPEELPPLLRDLRRLAMLEGRSFLSGPSSVEPEDAAWLELDAESREARREGQKPGLASPGGEMRQTRS